MSSRIWLGDAGRVLSLLQPDDSSAREIFLLLGLRPAPSAPLRSRPTPAPPPRPARPPRRTPPPPATAPIEPGGSQWLVSAQSMIEAASVEVIEPATRPAPELPRVRDVLIPPTETPLPSANLFAPNRQRALVSTVTSVRVHTGEVDVPRLAELACAGRPLVSLPTLTRWTNRRGLQLLVDVGEQMDLFARDQDELTESISQTAGPDGLQSLSFHRSPLSPGGAGSGPIWTWQRYQPPRPGIAVLALTDVGAFSPAEVRSEVRAEWLRLSARLGHQASRLIVLAPVPTDRFPRWLRRRISIVSWDRSTRIGEVLAAVRRSDRHLERR